MKEQQKLLYKSVFYGEITTRLEIVEIFANIHGHKKKELYRADLTLLLSYLENPAEYKLMFANFLKAIETTTITEALKKEVIQSNYFDYADFQQHQIKYSEMMEVVNSSLYGNIFRVSVGNSAHKKKNLISSTKKLEKNLNLLLYSELQVKKWTKEEEQIVLENLGNKVSDYDFLLPEKSKSAIESKACKLRKKYEN